MIRINLLAVDRGAGKKKASAGISGAQRVTSPTPRTGRSPGQAEAPVRAVPEIPDQGLVGGAV